MAFEDGSPRKRSLPAIDLNVPVARKRSRVPLRHKKIHWDFDNQKSFHDGTTPEDLLTRSISLALNAVGFDGAEPLALESMRKTAEQYMRHFLAGVTQSMLSCRRSQATAQDFLQALHLHQLSLRALLPHLEPPVLTSDARVHLPIEHYKEDPDQYDHHFLGSILSDALVERSKPYVPCNFPVLPSKHTYKTTAEFPVKEEDPRKVRERATAEGRLGEEVLRRLVGASTSDRPSVTHAANGVKSLRAQRDDLWKETMQAMSSMHDSKQSQNADAMDLDESEHGHGPLQQASSNYGRVSSVVNFDKKFWRKPGPVERTGQERGRNVI